MKNLRQFICAIFLVFTATWVFAAGQVNINTADAQTIAAELKGIGEKKAEAIIKYRTEHGPFKSVADITSVKGIGDKVLEDNAESIVIND
jgi:competence protein ComEA